MFSKTIIDKLQVVRRKTFPDYDQIVLDASAVPIFARLFLNPDCQTDIDLFALTGRDVKLSYLGDHIITAAPSTLAKYAQHAHTTRLTAQHLLRCFALDHAHDVEDNQMADKKNPAYALAHILSLSRVTALHATDDETTATLTQPTSWGSITFKHVLIPRDMRVAKHEWVYHHFGVIVGAASDPQFAAALLSLQKKDAFIASLGKALKRKRITVDFAQESMFGKDILGMLLHPAGNEIIKNPGDLSNGKITFKH